MAMKRSDFRTLDDSEPPAMPSASNIISDRMASNVYTEGFHKWPVTRSRLIIQDQVRFEFQTPMPGLWRRFWYWVLLGWTWEKVG